MIRGARRYRWRVVGWLLAAVLLPACAAQRAAEEQPPPPKDAQGEPLGPDQEPLPEVEVGAAQTTIEIREPGGQVIWEVTGRLRSTVSGETGTLELLDIKAVSRLPEYDATLTAGRLRYRLGDDFLLVDRRIFVGSPQRQADLEADAGRCELPTRQFAVPHRARLRTPEAVLEAESVTAAIDLREVTLTRPSAHERAATPHWRLAARTGFVDGQGVAEFQEVTGDLVRDGVTTTFGAPKAAWKPVQQWLNFNDGASLRREGFELSAAALTWRQADHKVVTRGETTLTRDRLKVTGTGGTVNIATRTGQLQHLQVIGPQLTLRAATGEVTAAGTVVLRQVHGTVDGATAVTAPQAVYDPGTRRLVLPAGGQAARDGATVRAERVVYDGGANRFTASGGVRLSEAAGTVTGQQLSGPSDLSTATLTPVTATGRQDGQAWRLNADSGTWRRGGAVSLQRAAARIGYRGRDVQCHAGSVRYEPGADRLVFEGGFRAESPADKVEVSSQRAIYSLTTQTFRAMGDVNAKARGVAVKSAGEWTYHLGAGGGEALLSSEGKPRAGQSGGAPKKEPAPAAAKSAEPVTDTAGEGAVDGATGSGDRPREGDRQGSELPGPDAGDAGAAGG